MAMKLLGPGKLMVRNGSILYNRCDQPAESHA